MRRVGLVAAVSLLLVVEMLNTAIEKLADRLTTDHDPQIGRVKDMGSAAVGVALLMAGAFWLFAIAERIGAACYEAVAYLSLITFLRNPC